MGYGCDEYVESVVQESAGGRSARCDSMVQEAKSAAEWVGAVFIPEVRDSLDSLEFRVSRHVVAKPQNEPVPGYCIVE